MLGEVRTCFLRPVLLHTRTAGRLDIAMLEGATLPSIFHTVLTRRCLLLLAGWFVADELTTSAQAGSSTAKDMKEIFLSISMQQPSSCARGAQRCVCGWHQRSRWTAVRRLHLRLCLDVWKWLLWHGAMYWGRLVCRMLAGARVGHTAAQEGHVLFFRIAHWTFRIPVEGTLGSLGECCVWVARKWCAKVPGDFASRLSGM